MGKWLVAILKWLFIGIGALVVLSSVFWMVMARARPPEKLTWKTEKISRGDLLLTVTATGTVGPLQIIQVGSQASGKVEQVLKGTNDLVKKGEPLALLDTELLEGEKQGVTAQLNQVKARLRQIQVERENMLLKEKRHGASVQRKEIAVARAKGACELAMLERKRTQDLLGKVTAQMELDMRLLQEANALRDQKMMEIDLAESGNDLEQIHLDQKALDVREDQAKADVQQAETQLNRAITNLKYATILSPIDGVILERTVTTGQTIAASFQTPNLFKIASSLERVQIDARIDEADIGKIKAGQKVTFEVDAYRGETFKGEVVDVNLQSDNKNNLVTYPVSILAENPSDKDHPFGKLRPGMTANLRFVVEERKNALLLPAAALRFVPPPENLPPKNESEPASDIDTKDAKDVAAKTTGTKGKVYVSGLLGMLEVRSISVGESDGEKYELLGGELKEGDEIVTGGGKRRRGLITVDN